MALLFFLFIISSMLAAINECVVIRDCNYALNRLSTQETCYCADDECIFEFNFNEINTAQSTSFITCDHTALKAEDSDIFTQCIINCNAPNSCNEFIVDAVDTNEVSINCESTNSCNLMEVRINNQTESKSIKQSSANIACFGHNSCDNLEYYCHQNIECELECIVPNSCNVCCSVDSLFFISLCLS